ncbi:hypothetical protein KQI65_04315 [bacterium]|nr:hypothetical protein [bacterium]
MRNLIYLFVLLVLALPVRAQDAIFRYEEGVEYKYLIEQSGLTIQEVQGRSITGTNETTISSILTVVEKLDGGDLRLNMLIESALAISEGPETTETSGTESAGKSVTFTLDADGHVSDVDTSIRALAPKTQTLLMLQLNIFARLDPEQLHAGGEWERNESDTTSSEEGTEIITETEKTYTVKAEKDINGHNSLEIIVETAQDIDGKIVQNAEIMVSGKREGKGKYYYSADEGLVTKIDAELNLDQTLMVTANNMRIPITSTQSMKIELVSP